MGAVEDSKAVMYALEEGLISVEDDMVEVNFEYSEPGERKPEGVLDYCLQTLIDLQSDEVLASGEENVLEFGGETVSSQYAKYNPPFSLNDFLGGMMKRYGFELEDPHRREDGGHQHLGNALKTIISNIDSERFSETSDRLVYHEGLKEEEINQALQSLEVSKSR